MSRDRLEAIIGELKTLQVAPKYSYGSELEIKCTSLLLNTVAMVLEDVLHDGMHTGNIQKYGDYFNIAHEQFRYGTLKDMKRVAVIENAHASSYGGPDPYFLQKDLNEFKHAGVIVIRSHDKAYVWADAWILEAVLYYRKEGFANMALRTFLKKMRPAEVVEPEIKQEDSRPYKHKYGARHTRDGKNEYRPRTRDRKY